MNGAQISKILENDSFTNTVFGGVHAKDWFGKIELKNKIFVFNTDDSNYPGSHWVAFNFSSTECEFFDSYGQSPITYGFPSVLQNYTVTYSNKVLQGPKSSVCGQYCILFLLLRCRGYSYDNILDTLTNDNTAEELDHVVNKAVLLYLKHATELKMSLKVHDRKFLANFFVKMPYCTLYGK